MLLRLTPVRLMLHRELEQRVAATQFQLEGDVVAVMFDGADTDVEQRRDLAAGLPFGNQLQDAALGRRELREGRLLLRQRRGAPASPDEKGREGGADIFLSGRHHLDAVDDLRGGTVLHHITLDPQVERGVQIVFVLVHRQQDDRHGEPLLADGTRHGKAVFDRHGQVEHCDIGACALQPLQGLLAVGGFEHDFELRL